MEYTKADPNADVNTIVDYIAHGLIVQEKLPSQVKKELVEKGASPQTAETIVEGFIEEYNKKKKRGGQREMLFGALWCVGGTVVTVMSTGMVIAWGAIIFGGIQFVRGIMATQDTID